VQKALPPLVDGASVILTGSTASIVAMPAFSVYGASKAALRSFASNWTLDLKERRRIGLNVLSPGPPKTPGLLGLAGDDQAAQQGLLDQLALEVPLGRVADPEQIATAALFLASDDSSFVTVAELFADGGQAQV
jgi:NAD(P)-dependent dehydrogenase (short-subunit alcohol dehydrogenase family)